MFLISEASTAVGFQTTPQRALGLVAPHFISPPTILFSPTPHLILTHPLP